MKSRDVVGKRIVKIQQTRLSPGMHRRMATNIDWIQLEDGTLITFGVAEGDCEYFIEATARKRRTP